MFLLKIDSNSIQQCTFVIFKIAKIWFIYFKTYQINVAIFTSNEKFFN